MIYGLPKYITCEWVGIIFFDFKNATRIIMYEIYVITFHNLFIVMCPFSECRVSVCDFLLDMFFCASHYPSYIKIML
jgi:hypothetical protein